ncbi:UNVERIFIED_CONTAM: hypothetical protein NCL1_27424 [Trichonephila clavipes]
MCNVIAASVSHSKSGSNRLAGSEHRNHKWKEEFKNISQKQTVAKREIQSLKQKVADLSKSNTDLEKKVFELQNVLSTHLEKVKEQDLRIEVICRLIGTDPSFPVVKLPDLAVTPNNNKEADTAVRIEVTETNTSTEKETLPAVSKKRKQGRRFSERSKKRLRKN